MRIDSVTYIAPNYPHKCDNEACGERQTFTNIKYPISGYKKVGEPIPYVGTVTNYG